MTDSNLIFPWPRYWFPEGDRDYNSFFQRGYLTLPSEEYRHYYSSLPEQLFELTQIPVLILLGDPGLGKSQALSDEHKRLKSEEADDLVVFCDLKKYGPGEQTDLKAELLDKEKLALVEQGRKLWVLIDGLDECGFQPAAYWLQREFINKIDHPECVFVRMTCRASSWPEFLENAFQDRWQSTNDTPVKNLRLCPLREEDVPIAASTCGIDGDKFLKAIAEREVEQLAAIPVTLGFMIELYKQGRLPQKRKEIFEQGLRLLCEDSPARRKYEKIGSVSTEARFLTAARLSVGYLLQGCNGIWNGAKLECPQGLLTAKAIIGPEARDESKYDIDETAITETLTFTGVFTRLDIYRFQFASRTFAEFLAAWYIAQSNVSSQQKLKLLLHPDSGRLIPDLYETAAWLAALDKQVLEWLIEHEPYAVLESDLATLAKSDLPALVDGLLEIAAKEERPSYDRERLSKLSYPGLDIKLAQVITDSSSPFASRALACRIARACELHSLGCQFADLALDAKADLSLRNLAARFLGDFENDDAKKRLVPLATTNDDLSLKGTALAVLGPRLMGAEAFFAQISPEFIENAPSDLKYIVYEESFLELLKPDDLLAGLHWLIAHTPIPYGAFSSEKLSTRILIQAFGHITAPGMVEEIVKILKVLRANHRCFFNGTKQDVIQNPLDDVEKRRILLAELIRQIEPEEASNWITFSDESCIRKEDGLWLLDHLDSNISESEHRVIAAILNKLIRFYSSTEVAEGVLNRAGQGVANPDLILAEQMHWLIKPTDLTSDETIEIRKAYLEYQAWEKAHKRQQESRQLPNPPQTYVERHLHDCEAGKIEQWPQLIFSLTYNEDGGYGFPHEPEELPIWLAADQDLRNRIAKIALSYIEQTTPPGESAFLKNLFTVDERSGGFAFEVLAIKDNLSQIKKETWERWSLALVAHYYRSNDRQESIFRKLRTANPDVFDTDVLKVLDHQILTGHLSLLNSLSSVWHPSLQKLLFTRLYDLTWPFHLRLRLAEFLIDRGVDEAIDQVKYWFMKEVHETNRLSAAVTLLESVPSRAWEDIQAMLTDDESFARKVVFGAVSTSHTAVNTAELVPSQLGWLFDRLNTLFPATEDPAKADVYTPTPRHDAARLRDSMIGRLVSMGTPDAVKELDRICTAYPDETWLVRARADGYQQLWRNERTQLTFPEAIKLLNDENATVVRNSRELMVAVEEALQRFAHEAQYGSPPLAVFLWDEQQKKPFSEQRLSDFLKFYLDREWRGRRIIINREVEIRNLRTFGVGERTDLLIQATLPEEESYQSHPCVVIEVKVDSNVKPEDIPKQLVGKYLDGESRACGIYLVGWFGKSSSNLESIRTIADQSAKNSSTDRIKVSSLVLDISHPLNKDK